MKKFINNPENLTAELLSGYISAYKNKICLVSEKIIGRVKAKDNNKVALVTLGGSGHEPALSGFVGKGMLDFSVVGDVFAAPGPPKVYEGLKIANRDAGTILIVLNHSGDVLSANMAEQLAEKDGIKIKRILTHEDIAAGKNAPIEDKRGLVGCVPLAKIAGAAAEAGKTLDKVYNVAEKFNQNMATLAVALTSATHPSTGDAIFELEDDEMEIGMGQHGEAGTGRSELKTAKQTAEIMAKQLCNAVKAKAGDRLLVILNGAGATTLMELYILFKGIKEYLDEQGIEIARSMVGEYLTVQEMGGFQMFFAKMDDELLDYWDAPCDTPYFTQN